MVFDTEWEHEEMGRRLNLNKPAHNAPTGIMRFMRQPSSGDAMTPTPTRPEPTTPTREELAHVLWQYRDSIVAGNSIVAVDAFLALLAASTGARE